jgi:hypothetical protein
MAFTSAITQRDIWGSMAVSMGTFTNSTGGDKGGNVDTGLNRCYGIVLQPGGGSVAGNAATVDETFTANGIAGSAVTIVTDADADGTWLAFGDQHS